MIYYSILLKNPWTLPCLALPSWPKQIKSGQTIASSAPVQMRCQKTRKKIGSRKWMLGFMNRKMLITSGKKWGIDLFSESFIPDWARVTSIVFLTLGRAHTINFAKIWLILHLLNTFKWSRIFLLIHQIWRMTACLNAIWTKFEKSIQIKYLILIW